MTALFHATQGAIVLALLLCHVTLACGLRTYMLAEGGYFGVARWRRRTAIVARWTAAALVAAGVLAIVSLCLWMLVALRSVT